MSAQKEKPSGIPPPDGLHNFIVQSSMTTIKTIAACNRQTCATGRFSVNQQASKGKRRNRLKRRCDSIRPGAQHTTKQAANIPDSDVFSRSEFENGLSFQGIHGYGAGSAYPQGRQHNLFCVLKPSSTLCPQQADGGLSVQQGTEAMTLTTPKTGNPSPLARQQAIETALSAALFHIRQPHAPAALHAATGRAIRAASLLKQACAELQNGGAA